ncbi:MAG: hypothetical protein JJU11_08595 [Candidatus Sumerlaeia bacterium]|nr:hypothetical protein [Candidatus Sumerlaeia bacterium]
MIIADAFRFVLAIPVAFCLGILAAYLSIFALGFFVALNDLILPGQFLKKFFGWIAYAFGGWVFSYFVIMLSVKIAPKLQRTYAVIAGVSVLIFSGILIPMYVVFDGIDLVIFLVFSCLSSIGITILCFFQEPETLKKQKLWDN